MRQPVALAAATLILTADIAGSAIASDGAGRTLHERPGAGGRPDEIAVLFGLLDIDDIDDKAQRFSIDAYYEISWNDPRLALDATSDATPRIRLFSIDEIWSPALTIVNDRGLNALLPDEAEVDVDGNVLVRQRLSGNLGVDLNLHRFPFDTQRLAADIVSYRYSPAELVFSQDTLFVGVAENFSAEGWLFEIQPPEYSTFYLANGIDGRAQLTFAVTAQRNAGFFLQTLALPMILILFLSWTVHWLQPDIIPARIGMSTATVFSLIALGVSFRLSMPQIDYLTQADRFVVNSTLLVLFSLGVTVLATRRVNQGNEEAALRLTVFARWAFPIAMIIGILLTLS